MLAYHNNEDLRKKNIDPKYFFLYQTWKELTDFRTMDSYQYKVMNTLSCIRELVEVIDNRLSGVYNTDHNVEECKLETREVIRKDRVLSIYYANYWKVALSNLSVKTETNAKKKALRYQLEYIFNIIQKDYMNKLIELWEDDIDSGKTRNIIEDTDKIISLCITNGWSTNALYAFPEILIDSVTDDGKWELFRSRILDREMTEYHVILPFKYRFFCDKKNINVRSRIRSMGASDYQIEDREVIKGNYPYIDNLENTGEFVDISVFAHDYYSASHIALSRHANILNMFSFYNIIEAWSIKDISWKSVNISKEKYVSLTAKNLYVTHNYMEGANRGFRDVRQVFDYKDVAERLNSVFFYTNMSRVSYAIEEKYMNMWVALESLCRTSVGSNIIGNVLDLVPAAICRGYIHRKIRNFIEDCSRCDIKIEKYDINYLEQDKDKLVKDMICVFKNEKKYQTLLSDTQINDLLNERAKEMYNLVESDENIIDAINRHRQNVSLQLSRLYRIRNSIAHTGMKEDVKVVRYIEHMEDYLKLVIMEIVRCMTDNNLNDIEIAIEMIKDEHNLFKDLSSGKKGAKTALVSKILETGYIDLL